MMAACMRAGAIQMVQSFRSARSISNAPKVNGMRFSLLNKQVPNLILRRLLPRLRVITLFSRRCDRPELGPDASPGSLWGWMIPTTSRCRRFIGQNLRSNLSLTCERDERRKLPPRLHRA
jgi:hypothetical protein